MYINPAGKLLYHIDRIADVKAGKHVAPINVEIDLSNRCSLGCEWCHFAYTHTRGPLAGKAQKPLHNTPGGDLMDYDLAVRILYQLDEAGVRSVTWTGGGEPTLHPDIERLLILVKRETNMQQGIYTHGGHIDFRRAGVLKQVMTWVYVSLDATDAGEYKRRKGVDRFQAATDGVRNLVKAEGGATVGVGFLLDDQNWKSATRAAHLALEELGADYVNFRPIIEFDMLQPGERPGNVEWIPGAIANLEALKRQFGQRIQADISRFEMYRDWQGHGYPVCYWSALQTVITPNGIMWTCVNKREHAGAVEGDLSTESLSDILLRKRVAMVDGACRVMCRGHIPNITLTEMMSDPSGHDLFI